MGKVTEHLLKQVEKQVADRGIVVWYDPVSQVPHIARLAIGFPGHYPVQLAKNKKLSSVVFVARTVEDWMPHFYKETGERLEEERRFFMLTPTNILR